MIILYVSPYSIRGQKERCAQARELLERMNVEFKIVDVTQMDTRDKRGLIYRKKERLFPLIELDEILYDLDEIIEMFESWEKI